MISKFISFYLSGVLFLILHLSKAGTELRHELFGMMYALCFVLATAEFIAGMSGEKRD